MTRAIAYHFGPRLCLDLGEFELVVIGVHGVHLLPCRRSHDLDDLHELVHARLAGEEGMARQELCHNAPR